MKMGKMSPLDRQIMKTLREKKCTDFIRKSDQVLFGIQQMGTINEKQDPLPLPKDKVTLNAQISTRYMKYS